MTESIIHQWLQESRKEAIPHALKRLYDLLNTQGLQEGDPARTVYAAAKVYCQLIEELDKEGTKG